MRCCFAQLASCAEAVQVLVAVGHWNISLAQALAAEIRERKLACLRWEQRHGMKWTENNVAAFAKARNSRKVVDSIGWRAYLAVTNDADGQARLQAYLAQPSLCGYCLNVKDNLAPCWRKCGRNLCTLCRTKNGICHNQGVCSQHHPIVWRAGIKLLDKGHDIYKEWHAAAAIADAYTERMSWGRRSDGHPEESNHIDVNLSENVVDRWERFHFQDAGLHTAEPPGC